MAGGIALSMLFGPLLADWRADWQLSALLVLAAALLLPLSVPGDDGRRAAGVRPAGLGTLLKSPAITLLALGFTTYNLQFFALMTFLPVFLMQRLGVALRLRDSSARPSSRRTPWAMSRRASSFPAAYVPAPCWRAPRS